MKTILFETEAFTLFKLIVFSFISDSSFSFKCEYNSITRCSVRCKPCTFIESHKYIFHRRVTYNIHISDAAFLIRYKILKCEYFICFYICVHIVLLFQY